MLGAHSAATCYSVFKIMCQQQHSHVRPALGMIDSGMWADLCLELDVAQALPQQAKECQCWRNWTGERCQRPQGCLKAVQCSKSGDTVEAPEAGTAHYMAYLSRHESMTYLRVQKCVCTEGARASHLHQQRKCSTQAEQHKGSILQFDD